MRVVCYLVFGFCCVVSMVTEAVAEEATGAGEPNITQPQLFSGPQIEETLTPFKARFAFGEKAGEEFDLISEVDGKPLMILFVHKRTRPAFGLMRVVTNYANRYQKDGMHCGIVFLSDDVTETDTWLRRIQNSPALPKGVPVGVSLEGIEGPGAYGLNRKMTITAIVGKDNQVTANFPLIQPSMTTDAPRIGLAIEQVLGRDKQPTLADMAGDRAGMMRARGGIDDGTYRAMIAPVIRKTATEEEVDAAAKKVEELAAKNPAFKTRVGLAANRIIGGGRLENYGTSHAQQYLKKWAKTYAGDDPPNTR